MTQRAVFFGSFIIFAIDARTQTKTMHALSSFSDVDATAPNPCDARRLPETGCLHAQSQTECPAINIDDVSLLKRTLRESTFCAAGLGGATHTFGRKCGHSRSDAAADGGTILSPAAQAKKE